MDGHRGKPGRCSPRTGSGRARRLARGLEQQGATVARRVPFASRRARRLRRTTPWTRRCATSAGSTLVVHGTALPASQPADLDALSLADWQRRRSGALFATLAACRPRCRTARARRHVVVIGPSTALVGAAGLVPLMTLAEAQRTLVKSAARQWGVLGMRLNWVGVAAAHYAPRSREAAAADARARPAAAGAGPHARTAGRRGRRDRLARQRRCARCHRRELQPRRRRLDGAMTQAA